MKLHTFLVLTRHLPGPLRRWFRMRRAKKASPEALRRLVEYVFREPEEDEREP